MLSSKQWNNKTSDIKLVYLYSTIKMIPVLVFCAENLNLENQIHRRAEFTTCRAVCWTNLKYHTGLWVGAWGWRGGWQSSGPQRTPKSPYILIRVVTQAKSIFTSYTHTHTHKPCQLYHLPGRQLLYRFEQQFYCKTGSCVALNPKHIG
jgi:hypothetical protein